jgi:hypothetical protein
MAGPGDIEHFEKWHRKTVQLHHFQVSSINFVK